MLDITNTFDDCICRSGRWLQRSVDQSELPSFGGDGDIHHVRPDFVVERSGDPQSVRGRTRFWRHGTDRTDGSHGTDGSHRADGSHGTDRTDGFH